MRNKILIAGAIAFVAYVLGSRAAGGRTRESVGHQIVRLSTSPKAVKARKKRARRAASTVKSTTRDLKKKLT